MAMTDRDKLEQMAAVILAGIIQCERYADYRPDERVDLAVTLAEDIRDEVRERHPQAWEKQEAKDDVPV